MTRPSPRSRRRPTRSGARRSASTSTAYSGSAAPQSPCMRDGGAIVNIGSINSLPPQSNAAAYCASKAALLQLTRSLALELAPRHIRANCVCPGIVDTPLTDLFLNQSDDPDGAPARVRAVKPAPADSRPERDRALRPVPRLRRGPFRHRERRSSSTAVRLPAADQAHPMTSRCASASWGSAPSRCRGILPHLTQQRRRSTACSRPGTLRPGAWSAHRRAAAQFGVPAVYASIDELLADDDIDAVTIASPIGLHFEHCRLALEAGKHVHVNKTMCTTVAEADALIDLAAENGLRIVASPGEVLRPQLTRTRELIEDGRDRPGHLGDLRRRLRPLPRGDEPERHRRARRRTIDPSWYFRKPGGGPMYDMTVYALHRLTSVLGPARRVTALSGVRIAERSSWGARSRPRPTTTPSCSLDFGDGLVAVAHGTAAGAPTRAVRRAGSTSARAATIDGVLLDGEPFEFPGSAETEARAGRPTGTRRCGPAARHRAASRDPRGARLRGHHAARRLGARRHALAGHRRARPTRHRHHRERLPGRRNGNNSEHSEPPSRLRLPPRLRMEPGLSEPSLWTSADREKTSLRSLRDTHSGHLAG